MEPPTEQAVAELPSLGDGMRIVRRLQRSRQRRKLGRRYRRARRWAHIPASRRRAPRRYHLDDLSALTDMDRATALPYLDGFEPPIILPGETPAYVHDQRPALPMLGGQPRYFYPDGSPIPDHHGLAYLEYVRQLRLHRRVALSRFYRRGLALDVSTVYLATDHCLPLSGGRLPIIYETLIFHNGTGGEQMWRYSTRAAALAGHRAICAAIRAHRSPARVPGPGRVPPLKVAYAGWRGW